MCRPWPHFCRMINVVSLTIVVISSILCVKKKKGSPCTTSSPSRRARGLSNPQSSTPCSHSGGVSCQTMEVKSSATDGQPVAGKASSKTLQRKHWRSAVETVDSPRGACERVHVGKQGQLRSSRCGLQGVRVGEAHQVASSQARRVTSGFFG